MRQRCWIYAQKITLISTRQAKWKIHIFSLVLQDMQLLNLICEVTALQQQLTYYVVLSKATYFLRSLWNLSLSCYTTSPYSGGVVLYIYILCTYTVEQMIALSCFLAMHHAIQWWGGTMYVRSDMVIQWYNEINSGLIKLHLHLHARSILRHERNNCLGFYHLCSWITLCSINLSQGISLRTEGAVSIKCMVVSQLL